MGGLAVAGLGAYLTAVGYQGRAKEFTTELYNSRDILLWIPAVGILYALNQSSVTRPIVAPFAMLTLLAFVLRNEPTIAKEVKTIYQSIK